MPDNLSVLSGNPGSPKLLDFPEFLEFMEFPEFLDISSDGQLDNGNFTIANFGAFLACVSPTVGPSVRTKIKF